jgi:LysM repeat protein
MLDSKTLFVMKFTSRSKRPNIRPFKRTRPWTAFLLSTVTALLTLGMYTGTAYAGLFSFIESFLEGTPASAQVITTENRQSSQTIALLQAATNLDPNPNKIADVAPIAGNSLIPEIAATNNVTDTEETSQKISTYVVRSGDNITNIAKMFNVSVSTVLWANGLTSKSVLQAGQTLVILPVSGVMYTVKKGDTVESIAKKYKADVTDIATYNDLSVSSLVVGQTIIIPDAEIAAIQVAGSKPSSTKKVSVGFEPLLDNVSNLPSYPGYYMRPISGGQKTQGLHGHNAVDLAAPVGTPIYAAAAGTVIINRVNGGWNGGYGNFLVIAHSNGSQTLYAHLQSKKLISAGESVSQGETIGYVGLTGLTTGAHLHFEVREAKNPF